MAPSIRDERAPLGTVAVRAPIRRIVAGSSQLIALFVDEQDEHNDYSAFHAYWGVSHVSYIQPEAHIRAGLRPCDANAFVGARGIRQVARGEAHTLFLTNDGRVFGCGSNSNGQLAFEKRRAKPVRDEAPRLLHMITDVVHQVAAGNGHSLFLLENRRVCLACGRGKRGQLGFGKTPKYQTSLVRCVFDESLRKIRSIYAEDQTSLFVVALVDEPNDSLLTCGVGKTLGTGERNDEDTPLPTRTVPPPRPPRRIVEVVTGHTHVVFIGDSGRVFSFGRAMGGVLGLPDVDVKSFATIVREPREVPRVVELLDSGDRVVRGAARFSGTALLSERGTLLACGSSFGALVDPTCDDLYASPLFGRVDLDTVLACVPECEYSARHNPVVSLASDFPTLYVLLANGLCVGIGRERRHNQSAEASSEPNTIRAKLVAPVWLHQVREWSPIHTSLSSYPRSFAQALRTALLIWRRASHRSWRRRLGRESSFALRLVLRLFAVASWPVVLWAK